MSNLNFADLIPEPLTYTDEDGTIYDVKSGALLSSADIAAIVRLERDSATALAKDTPVEADAALNRILRILVPSLPDERLAAMPLGVKTRIVEWWKDAQPNPKTQRARAATTTRATPAPRSRTSA